MKTKTGTVIVKSLLSIGLTGSFIILATGSLLDDLMKYDFRYLGNGIYEEVRYMNDDSWITQGERDKKGRWCGHVKVSVYNDDVLSMVEEGTMQQGKFTGQVKSTLYIQELNGSRTYTRTYFMGETVASAKKAFISGIEERSAFGILLNKYPYYFERLLAFNHDSVYVKSYLDTFELLLDKYSFTQSEFDKYYSRVVDSLEVTPYDSVIVFNSMNMLFNAKEGAKNSELRQAVIDRYDKGGKTYDIVSLTYPYYLKAMNDAGISDADFGVFTHQLDSAMASYGEVIKGDPFYTDSIDSKFSRALTEISKSKKSSVLKWQLPVFPSASTGNILGLLKDFIGSAASGKSALATPAKVAETAMAFSYIYLVNEEMFRKIVLEAWLIKKGISGIPVAATSFGSNPSPAHAIIEGFVAGDGGSPVTSRGIAWALKYNPVTEDNKVLSGSGTGLFSATVGDLASNTTYYARAFAVNANGTAYGNCIAFTVSGAGTVGIETAKPSSGSVTMYPNPAGDIVNLAISLPEGGRVSIIISDMSGRIIHREECFAEDHDPMELTMNIGDFEEGLYLVRISCAGHVFLKRLVVTR